PSANQPRFTLEAALIGELPTSAHLGKFCVLDEPLAPNAIGRAYVAGVFPCLIDVDEETEDFTRCDVRDGEAVLEMTPDGTGVVLWKEEGTGSKWAIVSLGGGG